MRMCEGVCFGGEESDLCIRRRGVPPGSYATQNHRLPKGYYFNRWQVRIQYGIIIFIILPILNIS